jgi:hypothetical protein
MACLKSEKYYHQPVNDVIISVSPGGVVRSKEKHYLDGRPLM